MNKQLDFIDLISLMSFVIGLQNLEENLTQGDKQELMQTVDEKTERVLREVKKELEYQNKILNYISERLG